MIKGVIFDMDGTVVDVPYDWRRIKEELQTEGKPILSYIQSLEEPERSEKWKILERYEEEATEKATLKEGMREFFYFLEDKGLKKALVTNNSRRNVDFLIKKFNLHFDLVLSREAGLWKPSGAPFRFVLKTLKIQKKACCVIGDSHFDVKAAADAGIQRIFILGSGGKKDLPESVEIVQTGHELRKRLEQLIEQ
jgi:HAD superfamily hydrolase (TIGR01549 family)